jgi:hypothetical protein
MADLDLRARLLALRRSTLSRLARSNQLEGELLRLVNDVVGTLAAIEAETMQAVAPIPGDRALIVDDNGQYRSSSTRPTSRPLPPRSRQSLRFGSVISSLPLVCDGCEHERSVEGFAQEEVEGRAAALGLAVAVQ